jgi:tetratricopeptide (TPR) repeat protein
MPRARSTLTARPALAAALLGIALANPVAAQAPASAARQGTFASLTPLELDESACGPLENGVGPYDYRTATRAERDIVERHHFTSDVELLIRGRSTSAIGGDLDYTLRAIPNHPRALLSLSRLSLREKRSIPAGAQRTVECYLERAMRFRPDDPSPYLVAGIHYAQLKRPDVALRFLERSAALAGDAPAIHYNLGLAFLDVGRPDEAMRHARIAYASPSVALPGLRDRLKAAGAWRE